MVFVKLAVFLCLLATIECADKGYGVACAQTDTCTVSGTACNDLDGDHGTACGCTADMKENGAADGCEDALNVDETCTTTAGCVQGTTCLDLDGSNTGTTKKCICVHGRHKQDSTCVGNPGAACTKYGLPCTNNAHCASTGDTDLPMTCRCNDGYVANAMYCVAGGNFVTASTLVIVVAALASRLFF